MEFESINGRLSAYIQILRYFSYCSDSLHVGQPRVINPHTFSHGHAIYSIQHAKDISDLMATSMNLMHENFQVTDGVYWIFSNVDVQRRITGLGKNIGKQKYEKEDIIKYIEELIKTSNNR